jgi:hypothetical protein
MVFFILFLRMVDLLLEYRVKAVSTTLPPPSPEVPVPVFWQLGNMRKKCSTFLICFKIIPWFCVQLLYFKKRIYQPFFIPVPGTGTA